ncbi:MAG: phosphoribosyl-AMP cyclohydrolase [Gammaproteobacteria bacterium]|nr:phosphoribosyl-AMP cyclohydrolase [Gammaproteobacteria bacterium]HBW84668.1 phosphoribosyl-AMP cyclohydrolase [Gammaproteobacteria bacterium]|tara:strand:+ start:11164 stop:11643 length:480 start_codon:yes stop_codon:yes gene_type:complete
MNSSITDGEIEKAREAWGSALIKISIAFENQGIEVARELASDAIDSMYGYANGPVLFKPTMASGAQTFRPTKDGALAYFVGHSDAYPLDGGFGIKGWREVVSETSESFIDRNIAMWMGWVSFTDKNGSVTKVDKSWGYKKDSDGTLRIVLHHSSLPYAP